MDPRDEDSARRIMMLLRAIREPSSAGLEDRELKLASLTGALDIYMQRVEDSLTSGESESGVIEINRRHRNIRILIEALSLDIDNEETWHRAFTTLEEEVTAYLEPPVPERLVS
jgi:hypothetical protein